MKNWITRDGQRIYRVLWGRCNCFLISYKNKHLLIDTGRKNRWKKLSKRLDQLGVSHNSLIALILTHSHFDHVENAASVKEKYKAGIIIHKSEADYLRRGENPAMQGTIFITRLITDVLAKKQVLRHFNYKPANGDILVDERYDLNHLGFNAYLLHTPGHSPGSMSLIIEDEIAIVGDAMFGVFRGSVFPPYADDPRAMVKSWAKLLDTSCSIYLPAHGAGRSREVLQRQYDKYKRVYDL